MSKHTQETFPRLIVVKNYSESFLLVRDEQDGGDIAEVWDSEYARRLASCWNHHDELVAMLQEVLDSAKWTLMSNLDEGDKLVLKIHKCLTLLESEAQHE